MWSAIQINEGLLLRVGSLLSSSGWSDGSDL